MNNQKVNYPILITESEGADEDEFVYAQIHAKTDLVRINPSLNSKGHFLALSLLKEIFLPRGYPKSVSEDYINYQTWDTVQAFCSTITATLATKAILKGIGVGDETANTTSAAVTWILKDGIGLLSRIAFAWMSSSGLDRDCKKWRMFADIVNDVAIFVELVILNAYSEYAIYILCFSTSLKGLVGVAGGATRAAITQHQAIHDNMADVSAKDGSQETCVNLIASFIGVAFLSYFGKFSSVWFMFFFLTFLHLYANYRAVKSLNFNYFNTERFLIFLKYYLISSSALGPREVNMHESCFLGFGESEKAICGHRIVMGCSLQKILNKKNLSAHKLQFFTHMYKSKKFMIFICEETKKIYVLLNNDISSQESLEAYFHAIYLGIGISFVHDVTFKHRYESSKMFSLMFPKSNLNKNDGKSDISFYLTIDSLASENVIDFFKAASLAGWDLDRNVLHVGKWRANWDDRRHQKDL